MDPKVLRIIGVVCLIACAVLVFVAVERYNDNKGKVAAMNQMTGNMPMGNMLGGEMKAATPAATKYAALFAAICAIGGGVCFVLASKPQSNYTGQNLNDTQ